uniref:Nucleotide-diphospho-sugar transferase domain-containing protein n=1 Tax=Meloidogyne incognita TaxID=6306 RepID=A0A914MKY8_MELIC
MRKVSKIQNFLTEQSKSLFNNQNELNDYREQFRKTLSNMNDSKTPAILLLNKYALNISLNFLCNLRNFPGAVDHIVAVVFDSYSHQILKESFTDIGGIVYWDIPALEEKFSSGDGRYQVFQYFRAKLVSLLTEVTDQFWMVQADTIWKENLFEIIDTDSQEFINAGIIFDSEGSEGLLRYMIAGGYFFVRSANSTKKFFESAAEFLLNNFATDNNVMNRLCIQKAFGVECGQINYSIISNWRMSSTLKEHSEDSPPLFQFDGDDGSTDKFNKIKNEGYLFVDLTTKKCLSDNLNIKNRGGNSTKIIENCGQKKFCGQHLRTKYFLRTTFADKIFADETETH